METWNRVMAQLRRDGLSFKYHGTWYLTDAISMTVDEERPLMLTKEVYPAIAAATDGQSWRNVERNIRTALAAAGVDMEAGEYIREKAAEVLLNEN